MPRRSPRQFELPVQSGVNDVAHAHIAFGATLIPYAVKRRRRRNGSYSLSIDERGLRIGVSQRASPRWIEDVLRRHEDWIVRKFGEWQARRVEPVRWEDGAALMLLGKSLCLTLVPERREPAKAAVRALMWPDGDGPRRFRNETRFILGVRAA